MPILFKKVEQHNPLNPDAPKKWYARLKRISLVREKEIARQIADETTLNPKEAEMALDQMLKVIIRVLETSNSVQLGDWGSFHLTCNSTGQERKEDVTVATIDKINIRFTPGKELKEALQKMSLKDIETL